MRFACQVYLSIEPPKFIALIGCICHSAIVHPPYHLGKKLLFDGVIYCLGLRRLIVNLPKPIHILAPMLLRPYCM